MQLDALFRPTSIAVIGKPTIGRRRVTSLDRIGFAGRVFPVNPNYSTVLGRRCWPSIVKDPIAVMELVD
jgi:acetate---CoA ligase (ADP-forming)